MILQRRNTARIPRRLRFWVVMIWVLAGLTATAGCRGSQEPVRRDTQPLHAPQAVTQPASPRMQMPAPAQAIEQQGNSEAADKRKKRFAVGSADLLKLAQEIKVEVDKATVDVLSVKAIRKASEIEHLARKLRDQMKSVKPAEAQP